MDELKNIFGDKAMTYDEFSAALEQTKDIKLVNLSAGGYVSKDKLDAATAQTKEYQSQLAEANKQIESFKEMDIDGIKKAADDWKAKAEQAEKDATAKVQQIEFNFALESALRDSKAKNITAVSALLNKEGLKLVDGKIIGLDEQISKIKADNDYLFESDKPVPKLAGATDGKGNLQNITKEQFAKMGYNQRKELKAQNPELYESLKE